MSEQYCIWINIFISVCLFAGCTSALNMLAKLVLQNQFKLIFLQAQKASWLSDTVNYYVYKMFMKYILDCSVPYFCLGLVQTCALFQWSFKWKSKCQVNCFYIQVLTSVPEDKFLSYLGVIIDRWCWYNYAVLGPFFTH